ncbi:MAG: acyltransferase [Novosphingobium pentaromativorans]|uniref:Acyltransferase n=1 Tax=Novosphingobium pentaromativorans TaxID=205844 RepID=A0A2W5P3U1_9SPHN|nr:acyltransferase [Novosphingobium panipatense]PZQ57515.1 MAG: acyltransferase [Novosphingobium pentaromativorans]
MKHYLGLDGLRGVAAVAVVLFHRRWLGPGGHFFDQAHLAVNFFFILSGFVIDHAYAERLKQGGISLGRFVTSRIVRLYPLIILGTALGFTYWAGESLRTGHPTMGTLFLATLLSALCLPAPSSLMGEMFAIDRPLWSLFYEIVANLIFVLILFRLPSKAVAMLAAIGVAASLILALRFNVLNVGYKNGDIGWGMLNVLPSFVMGMALNRMRGMWNFSMPFWLSSVLLAATFLPHSLGAWQGVYGLVMVTTFYPALILSSLDFEEGARSAAAARFSAFISYPLYALHYPLLFWVSKVADKFDLPGKVELLAGLLISVAVAWIAGKYYDEPVREFLSKALRKRPKLNPTVSEAS